MTTQKIGQALGRHLARIEEMLPDEYKLTLVVRNTSRDDADVVIGNDDDLEQVIRAIANLREAESIHIDVRTKGDR